MGQLAAFIGVVIVLGVLVYVWSAGAASRALHQRERAELERLRALVDDLKDTAWDHRELDSALAAIMIEKIRAHERRGRELGP